MAEFPFSTSGFPNLTILKASRYSNSVYEYSCVRLKLLLCTFGPQIWRCVRSPKLAAAPDCLKWSDFNFGLPRTLVYNRYGFRTYSLVYSSGHCRRWCSRMQLQIMTAYLNSVTIINRAVLVVSLRNFVTITKTLLIISRKYELYPLFMVRSWNNNMRCMSICILK